MTRRSKKRSSRKHRAAAPPGTVIDQRYQRVEHQVNVGHLHLDLPQSGTERRNRLRMIERVHYHWVDDYLERFPLLLPLHLCEQPALVAARRLRTLRHVTGPQSRALPAGTPLIDVYDQAAGAVLVVGESGSGKSLLLAELAKALLERARQREDAPFPVIFHLSSWAIQQPPLTAWLTEKLCTDYGIQHDLAQAWVENDALIPLLDGLDSVKETCRQACVHAINDYRSQHQQGLVVCCQSGAYEQLPVFLELHQAVMVQPLTVEQITTYLERCGETGASIRAALGRDPEFALLAQTPLLLDLLVKTYAGQPPSALEHLTSSTNWSYHLFAAYVERMLQQPENLLPLEEAATSRQRAKQRARARQPYTAEQTKCWLSWLAKQLIQHDQREVVLEYMQLDWLPSDRAFRFTLGWQAGSLSGVAFAFLIFFLAFIILSIATHLVPAGSTIGTMNDLENLRFSALLAMVAGVAVSLFISGAIHRNARIRPAEIVAWSWQEIGKRLPVMVTSWIPGFLVWLVGAPRALPQSTWLAELCTVIPNFAFFHVLNTGLQGKELEKHLRLRPNIGIRRSARNGFLLGLLLAASTFFFAGLGSLVLQTPDQMLYHILVRGGLLAMPALLFLFQRGGLACCLHVFLRMGLKRCGAAPWRYVRFLDYATSCHLLHRIGRGYMFYHPKLRDYFAQQDLSSQEPR